MTEVCTAARARIPFSPQLPSISVRFRSDRPALPRVACTVDAGKSLSPPASMRGLGARRKCRLQRTRLPKPFRDSAPESRLKIISPALKMHL
jgi:hypothetical protein